MLQRTLKRENTSYDLYIIYLLMILLRQRAVFILKQTFSLFFILILLKLELFCTWFCPKKIILHIFGVKRLCNIIYYFEFLLRFSACSFWALSEGEKDRFLLEKFYKWR